MIDLDAIEARANAATEGPWAVHDGLWFCFTGSGANRRMVKVKISEPDGVFSANARTDVPALVAEVRRLREIARVSLPVWEWIVAGGPEFSENCIEVAADTANAIRETLK